MDSVFFTGPAGRLDARLHGPSGGFPVLLLHPHPRFGGTMGSRLVHDLAVALGGSGFRAVRFNFRGVGRSEGAYGHGMGEVEDAVAVFDALAAGAGRAPAVVGYSFGAAVACRLATQRAPERLVLVGCPLRLAETSLDPLRDAPQARCGLPPAHLVVGDQDGFVTPAQARRLADAFLPPGRLTVLPGAAHFLEPGHNPRAAAAVLAALA
ncbi:MAG TPA: alpha/beta fold hydrolase [Candidatus Thermoplasmatota archaeon]|nr:alpha/beta fold hydrolase [Candidatus Thermoplasmatota archaeon]